jgi:hypothetical protein
MKTKLGLIASVGVALSALLGGAKAWAAYTTFTCTPAIVQLIVSSPTGQPRIAVSCTASAPGGIFWFAFRTSDGADSAKMLLSTLTSAKIAGRTLNIGFESTDKSGDAWGCDKANCRIIKKIEVN